MSVEVLQGDARAVLKTLPAESVHMVVTSPPYWGLRNYGVDQQIGLERTPELYVAEIVAVFREVWRVLHPSGTVWLNLGDSYSSNTKWGGSTGGKHVKALHGGTGIGRTRTSSGLKPKDLCMIPARVALALQAEGWWLRSEIAWCKCSPMPESVTDRPTSATEKIFLLTKSERYFYDAVAVAEPSIKGAAGSLFTAGKTGLSGLGRVSELPRDDAPTRNMRNYWLLSPEPWPGSHFAVMPSAIPERAILAGTSEHGVCSVCGSPWKRITERHRTVDGERVENLRSWGGTERDARAPRRFPGGDISHNRYGTETVEIGWEPTCKHPDAPVVPAVVLDPFLGAGTTLVVATRLGRDGIGIELNPEYVAMAEDRIARTQPALVPVREEGA